MPREMAGSSHATSITRMKHKQPCRAGSVIRRVGNQNSHSQECHRLSDDVFLPVDSIESPFSKYHRAAVLSQYRPGHHVIIPSFVEHRTRTRSMVGDRFWTVVPVNEATSCLPCDTNPGQRWDGVSGGSCEVKGGIVVRPRISQLPNYGGKIIHNKSRLFLRYDLWSKKKRGLRISHVAYDDNALNKNRNSQCSDLNHSSVLKHSSVVQSDDQRLHRSFGGSRSAASWSYCPRLPYQDLSKDENVCTDVLSRETHQRFSLDILGASESTYARNRLQNCSLRTFFETDLDESCEYQEINSVDGNVGYTGSRFEHSSTNAVDQNVIFSSIKHSSDKLTGFACVDNSYKNTSRAASGRILLSDENGENNNSLSFSVPENLVSHQLTGSLLEDNVNRANWSVHDASLMEPMSDRLPGEFTLSPSRPVRQTNSETGPAR